MVTREQRGHSRCSRLEPLPTAQEVQAFWDDLETRLDELAERLIAEIRSELPSYQALPASEQVRTVRELLGAMTTSLSSGELPQPRRLQMIRASARRRAYYGMPVYDVLTAFHFAHRGLWSTFRSSTFSTEHLLVDLVEPMASWAQAMSQAVIDAYVDEQGGRDSRENELRSRLFDALDDPARDHAAIDALRELAYDPGSEFTVLVARHQNWTRESMAALQRACRRFAGVAHTGSRSGLMILIVQGIAVDDVVDAARDVVGPLAIGVGLPRSGAAGIRLGIVDARRALEVAEALGSEVVHFAQEWFLATLLSATAELDPLLERAVEAARLNPDLADAVLAFADCGYSLAGAGEKLRLNANSVSYRLGRWRERTDLDVRRFTDLARSVLAIARARSPR